MGIKYEMKTEKPEKMGNKEAQELKNIVLAPYMQLATGLIGKARHAGGNMFRHQMDTLAILIDYGYIDSVLLKASVVHDTVEDIKDFDRNLILNADDEGEEVLNLVLEVTRSDTVQILIFSNVSATKQSFSFFLWLLKLTLTCITN